MSIDRLLDSDRFFLTDGGLETFMVFEKGFDLPCFSAASLLESAAGRDALTDYFDGFAALAKNSNRGFILDVPTWRAGLAWAEELGLSAEEVLAINADATSFMRQIRDTHASDASPILLNGLIGPAGDAYSATGAPGAEEAFAIHAPQIRALGRAGVDMISALTLTQISEAVGIARAAREIDMPIIISFTVETDGALPSGPTLKEAILQVDAQTNAAPAYYMINCAHPDHFAHILEDGGEWIERIGGLRTNASRLSHAELDEAEELDAGDPTELAQLHAPLMERLPALKVVGGCCGTDLRHVACLADMREEQCCP